MTQADFDWIESSLGYPVPDIYRDFMIAHADELRAAKTAMPMRSIIYLDANDVIQQNLYVRKHAQDVFPVGREEEPFPVTYFVIGDNGGGDYWFVKRESPSSGVWFYECESYKIHKTHKSLQDYIDAVRKDMLRREKWRRPGK